MPKRVKALTAIEVKRLSHGVSKDGKPFNALHAVGDPAGLLLQVTPTGGRSWLLRTLVGGKRRSIGLGSYPAVPLAKARELAVEALQQIKTGVDPIAQKQEARKALAVTRRRTLTFREAAEKCHAARLPEIKNYKAGQQWINSLRDHAFPTIGDLPVDQIDVQHIVDLLMPIWTTKTETASRVRQRIETVLDWSTVMKHRSGENPARLKGNIDLLLPRVSKIKRVKHHRALHWSAMPEFMQRLRERNGMGAKALEFVILTAARSGRVRAADWSEVDLEARLWTIEAENMKGRKAHRVPLSDRAVELLESMPHRKGLIFPSAEGIELSDMTLAKVLRDMDVDAVPHGFRTSFRTWVQEQTSASEEAAELSLGHVNNDATRAAYARGELLEQRTVLMQQWAQYLDGKTATVTPIRSRRHG